VSKTDARPGGKKIHFSARRKLEILERRLTYSVLLRNERETKEKARVVI